MQKLGGGAGKRGKRTWRHYQRRYGKPVRMAKHYRAGLVAMKRTRPNDNLKSIHDQLLAFAFANAPFVTDDIRREIKRHALR